MITIIKKNSNNTTSTTTTNNNQKLVPMQSLDKNWFPKKTY